MDVVFWPWRHTSLNWFFLFDLNFFGFTFTFPVNKFFHSFFQIPLKISRLIQQAHINTSPVDDFFFHNQHDIQNLSIIVDCHSFFLVWWIIKKNVELIEIFRVFLFRRFFFLDGLFNLLRLFGVFFITFLCFLYVGQYEREMKKYFLDPLFSDLEQQDCFCHQSNLF